MNWNKVLKKMCECGLKATCIFKTVNKLISQKNNGYQSFLKLLEIKCLLNENCGMHSQMTRLHFEIGACVDGLM